MRENLCELFITTASKGRLNLIEKGYASAVGAAKRIKASFMLARIMQHDRLQCHSVVSQQNLYRARSVERFKGRRFALQCETGAVKRI